MSEEEILLDELAAVGLEAYPDCEVLELAVTLLDRVFVDEGGASVAKGFDPKNFVPGRLLVSLLGRMVEAEEQIDYDPHETC